MAAWFGYSFCPAVLSSVSHRPARELSPAIASAMGRARGEGGKLLPLLPPPHPLPKLSLVLSKHIVWYIYVVSSSADDRKLQTVWVHGLSLSRSLSLAGASRLYTGWHTEDTQHSKANKTEKWFGDLNLAFITRTPNTIKYNRISSCQLPVWHLGDNIPMHTQKNSFVTKTVDVEETSENRVTLDW